jgi:hypothetical protein
MTPFAESFLGEENDRVLQMFLWSQRRLDQLSAGHMPAGLPD